MKFSQLGGRKDKKVGEINQSENMTDMTGNGVVIFLHTQSTISG